jgi:ankyrin repeat protein
MAQKGEAFSLYTQLCDLMAENKGSSVQKVLLTFGDAARQALSITDNDGWTVLHSACKHADYTTILSILQFGADASALTKKGASVLHLVCVFWFIVAVPLVEFLMHSS